MKLVLIALSLMVAVLGVGTWAVSAQCSPAGTAGDDTITCTGTSSAVNGGGGSDSITVDGTLTGNVSGGTGADTITVDGTVNGNVFGDINGTDNAASDTIIINGHVTGSVVGDSGNGSATGVGGDDTIIINGQVDYQVQADFWPATNGAAIGGNDTVILRDGANGGADNQLFINAFGGTDTLIFQFTVNSRADYQAVSALIASANPTFDSLVINGQTFTWQYFENLVNELIRNYGLGSTIVIRVPATDPPDGRVNWHERGFAPVAIYCRGGKVEVYNADGQLVFAVSADAIQAAFAASTDTNQRVDGAAGFSLWTLNQTFELQVHAEDGGYYYIFPAFCIL